MTRCRVCHSTDTAPLPFEVPANEGRWVRCAACGSDTNSFDYDPGGYGNDYAGRHRAHIGGPEAARREVSSNCEWFGHHHTLTGNDFLDVGCADGAALGYMAVLGWSVHGFDVAPPDYGGPHVTVAPAFNRWLFPRRYDAVMCREVLEHVECPRLLLAELHGVTLPGGLVQVQTPKPCERFYGHIYQSPHLFIASVPQLLRMLDEALLDVVESREWDSGQAHLCRAR